MVRQVPCPFRVAPPQQAAAVPSTSSVETPPQVAAVPCNFLVVPPLMVAVDNSSCSPATPLQEVAVPLPSAAVRQPPAAPAALSYPAVRVRREAPAVCW